MFSFCIFSISLVLTLIEEDLVSGDQKERKKKTKQKSGNFNIFFQGENKTLQRKQWSLSDYNCHKITKINISKLLLHNRWCRRCPWSCYCSTHHSFTPLLAHSSQLFYQVSVNYRGLTPEFFEKCPRLMEGTASEDSWNSKLMIQVAMAQSFCL